MDGSPLYWRASRICLAVPGPEGSAPWDRPCRVRFAAANPRSDTELKKGFLICFAGLVTLQDARCSGGQGEIRQYKAGGIGNRSSSASLAVLGRRGEI